MSGEVLDQEILEMKFADVSDLLLQKLCENLSSGERDYSSLRLLGRDENDELYELTCCMRRKTE